ncbi:MAG: SagB/ThcOx family dehydrogenase [Promethearchaeota archaeon]|nr:MAG: SagB/ThcOx family dehydrogenase [Candidatus Lokiarchaeota archaeon]
MDIELLKPLYKGEMSLEESIFRRKSVRSFSGKVIEIEKVSQLIWAAQGKSSSKRTAPSAGAIYPLEVYVFLKNQGIYYYNFKKNILNLRIKEDENENLLKQLAQFSLNQNFIYEAPLNIMICVDFPKIIRGYGERGRRYALIEVGHCAQNIHLEAVSLGLVSVPIGAFQDKLIKQLLQLPENIDPIYIIPIGYAK